MDAAQERVDREREAVVARARCEGLGEGQKACRDCGLPIAPARRRALPSAVRCLDCQELAERGSRMRRG